MTRTLKFKGPYQAKHARTDNFENFILWIKDFKLTMEDYGLDRPLFKSIENWFLARHNVKCLPPNFVAWITNHKGLLTFTAIKNWIATEAHTRDDIAMKARQSLLPQLRAVVKPKVGAKGKIAEVADPKATPQPAKVPKECKEKCQVCGVDTGECHWAVSVDGLTVLCLAAKSNPSMVIKLGRSNPRGRRELNF